MKTKLLIPVLALIAGGFSCAVEVDADAQKLLGLETAILATKTLPPEVPVFGAVLSPAPLIDLFRQIVAAQAVIGVSSESLERAEKLFASGELVARKDVQAAQAQLAQDKVLIQALEDRLSLEWGQTFSKLTAPDRAKLLDDLLLGRQALVRLSVSRGERFDAMPLAARLHSAGNEFAPLRCGRIIPAPAVDPAFQGRAFFGLIETPASPLAAGLALTGSLELKSEEQLAGKFVPQNTVVFYLGKAWIYQKSGDDQFERLEISTQNPIDGGWFVNLDLLTPQEVVTKGAQSLLSKETLGPAEEE
ncbi:MAG: hypothetical protein ABIS50_13535 [Luteolibacter sp.]|uniref:hypothetical protein n=1 Tax=Luteolibacter sp. TaxID=1962973 RepID=UPI003265E416